MTNDQELNYYQQAMRVEIEQLKERIKDLEAENKELRKGRPDKIDDLYISLGKAAKQIKELEAKNEQLEKWQIKPSEAICLTDLACRCKKVFKND